jgi:phosphate transport system permease protein/phosphate transport system substrate-binding protein
MFNSGLDRKTLAGMLIAGVVVAFIAAPGAKAYAVNRYDVAQLFGAKKLTHIKGTGTLELWTSQYRADGVRIDYGSNSGSGLDPFLKKAVDYAITDTALTAAQRNQAAAKVVHIPQSVSSLAIVYNIPGIPKERHLKLTGPVLADIYLGKIRKWDDPRIKELNPDLPLPSLKNIFVVQDKLPSWTTLAFTSYLSEVSPEWKQAVGSGTSVNWPVDYLGKVKRQAYGRAAGTESVASWAAYKPYAIGYVDYGYAESNSLAHAAIANNEGVFVLPSKDSIGAAVDGYVANNTRLDNSTDWASVMIANAPGRGAYPIASFTYTVVYQELSATKGIASKDDAKALVDFIKWTTSQEGRRLIRSPYIPLPDSVAGLAEKTISTLTYKGQSIAG